MSRFSEEYKRLNLAQRQAVDTIEGPVLVLAGPGTGKTQLLSMRVANILQKSDADASNILCLTFTNKAAINMRQRLNALTNGAANDVYVKTFHSFAAELMNMYPDYFWSGARLTTAPDATQLSIIQDILSGLPLSNPLAVRFAGSFTAGNDVKRGLRLVKEAGLTPDKLRAIIQANLAYLDVIEPTMVDILSSTLSIKRLDSLSASVAALPKQGITADLAPLRDLGEVLRSSLEFAVAQDHVVGKTTKTGAWKRRYLQTVDGTKGMFDERKRNEWWLSLADVYQQYRDRLHARGHYDYSDMVVEVISQLELHADMRADVQEKFLYVLIDEFQDTNAAQLRLAHLVADHHASAGRPNLMVVGDDDQSIYKFNGAELNNMLSFQTSYPSSRLIVLTDNYRSSQDILNTAAAIIDKASDRLVRRIPDISKTLKAVNTPTTKGKIEHRLYTTQPSQFGDVADTIARLHSSGDTSVAVLARSHASLRSIAAELTARQIPVRYEQQTNILLHPLVVQIHTVLSLLVAIKQGDTSRTDALLSTLLRHPAWNIEPAELWKLAITKHRHSDWLSSMQSSTGALHTVAEWLLGLANLSSHEPLAVILEYVIGLQAGEGLTSPLREYFLSLREINNDYLSALSALRVLTELSQEFSLEQQATVDNFVAFLDISLTSNDSIADETIYASGPDAVELLTVHKAKGLEFGTVFVIDAVDSNWRPSAGGRKPPANLPLQPPGDDADDYARLMFVAATRAKHSLIVTSYQEDTTGKPVLTSPLILDALTTAEVARDTPVQATASLEQYLAWPRLNSSDEKSLLSDRLASFSLSSTALLDFLDLSQGGPAYFFERHLLHLPQATTSQMAFGTAMHAALERAQILTNAGTYTLAPVLSWYEEVLQRQNISVEEQQRYNDHGQQLLTKLLGNDTFWLPKSSIPEQNLSDVMVGNARLTGKIDRLDSKDGQLTIVDYKTGKPLASLHTKDQTKAIKAWRHRTQMLFYSVLVGNSARFSTHRAIDCQLIYVEASTPRELIRAMTPTPEEIQAIEQLIQATWKHIQNLSWPDVSRYPTTFAGIEQFTADLLK